MIMDIDDLRRLEMQIGGIYLDTHNLDAIRREKTNLNAEGSW